MPVLTIMILLPLVVGAALLVWPGDEHGRAAAARWLALGTTLVELALGILLWLNFDVGLPGFQFAENVPLFAPYFSWSLGIDGISLVLIMLSVFLMPICILASWESVKTRVPEYMAAFLLMEALMIGVFAATDLFLFYVMFEGGLIPMYLIIGIWGGANRIYASYKFFLYTLLGSVLMLVAMLYMAVTAGTTYIPDLLVFPFDEDVQIWLWLAFFASFAVKMPMWPVHTWLPDAHVQAPTAGSVILAGVLLKLGGYGFIRFSLPMFPDASVDLMWLVFALSMIAVVYTSLVALAQRDMKKLIAYSSVAHMAFVTVGLFGFNQQALEGSIVVMLSHGLVSGALFLCVGVVYDRLHTREIDAYGGVANVMPRYAVLFLLFTMASNRPARHQRLHWRVPGHARRLSRVDMGGVRHLHRHHPRRRLHAVPLPPRGLRQGDERGGRRHARPDSARICLPRAHRAGGAVDGRGAERLYRPRARAGCRHRRRAGPCRRAGAAGRKYRAPAPRAGNGAARP